MPIQIIGADERLARKPKINIALFGPAGVGKTFQARYLNPETTLFVDLEGGTLALKGDQPMPDGSVLPEWRGDVLDNRIEATKLGVHPWEFSRAIACLLAGPDPSAAPGTPYSADMHALYCERIAPPATFDKYDTIFVDSITVAARHCFSWSQRQPDAFSEKTGKPDTRGAYGLHGREMVQWLTQLQHISQKSVIVVGILDVIEDKDIPGRVSYEPQIDGSKAGRELPGIFDQVITLGRFAVDSVAGTVKFDVKKGTNLGFVCHQNNPFGVPGKSRAGCLDPIEPADLGALMRKIATAPRRDAPPVNATAPAAAA